MDGRNFQPESGKRPDVKVYQFEINFNRPIQFYLEESHEQRFQTVLADNAGAIEESHFWLAFRDSREREKGFQTREKLENKGYQLNEEFAAGEVDERVYLLFAQK